MINSSLITPIISAIAELDQSKAHQYITALSNDEAKISIDELLNLSPIDIPKPKHINVENEYEYNKNKFNIYFYALMISARDIDDLEKINGNNKNGFFNFDYGLNVSYIPDLIKFWGDNPPDYFKKFINKTIIRYKKEDKLFNYFQTLWYFYQIGATEYDEKYFIHSLMYVPMFNRSVLTDAQFLMENPNVVENLLYKITQYETKILDRSKWHTETGYTCDRITNFWDEVFAIMQREGFVFARSWIDDLLASLNYSWKKPHLEWHIRIIEFLQPNIDELIRNQDNIFALFSSPFSSIAKYAVELSERIYRHKDFDDKNFVENIHHLFIQTKQAKSQIKVLDILDAIWNIHHPDSDYHQKLSILLMHSDAKLQNKTAEMLLKYFNHKDLLDSILTYQPYFNTKTQEIFKEILSSNQDISDTSLNENYEIYSYSNVNYDEIIMPNNWTDLLFFIGDCIQEKSAATIDVLLESINQLNQQKPDDFAKQLAPHIKTLSKHSEYATLPILYQLIKAWAENSTIQVKEISKKEWNNLNKLDLDSKDYKSLSTEYDRNTSFQQAKNILPFLLKKCNWLLEKIKDNNTLPFISTPTHAPFYIDAEILVDRLLAYEKANILPDLEDVIVACNRLLPNSIHQNAKNKVILLQGLYKNALAYYYDIHDEINKNELFFEIKNNSTKGLLPLWSQISRLKHPERTFQEYNNTKAKDISSVIAPFYPKYQIEHNDSYGYHFSYLSIKTHHDLRINGNSEKNIKEDKQYYYHALIMNVAYRNDIVYQLSLNPNYADMLLCRYTPSYDDNAKCFSDPMTYLLQALVYYHIPIRQGGLIFVAHALLFIKKEIREMANEYIIYRLMSGDKLEYLSDCIAYLIAQKYLPVNRLIEFLDKKDKQQAVILFKYQILSKCIVSLDKDHLPTGYKKLISYYQEFANLSNENNSDIQQKILNLTSKNTGKHTLR